MGLYEGIKDVAKVMQQADNIKLYQQLLDLCAQALELQSEVNRLTKENDDLREKQDIESKIVRYDGLFITLGDDTSAAIIRLDCKQDAIALIGGNHATVWRQ